MRKLLAVLTLTAALAWAGSRASTGTGATPTSATDGVNLADSEGCRVSARLTDGGTLNGGTLATWYYDSVVGWVRSATSLDCTLEASKLIDAGAPSAQVCPDLQPAAKFGRIAAEARNLTQRDGGAVTAIVRVECWGANIP